MMLVLPFLAISLTSMAEEYPTKEIHAICNFPAGTGGDIFVRFFSDKIECPGR